MINKQFTPDWWKEAAYLTRYAGSGMINTIVGFIVIFSLMALGASPILSNIAGYAVGYTLLMYVLTRLFVFGSASVKDTKT
jgi:putative flippase GtrA